MTFRDRSIKRHLAKSVTWRIVGTIDTMILGWFISGNPLIGIKIGALEVITKMILYFFHERVWYRIPFGIAKRENRIAAQRYLIKERTTLSRINKEHLNGHISLTIWFTGLSGSGKSTIANLLEEELHKKGVKTYILDGDNTRLGINKDLDFTPEGRAENIRRVAEISRLMNDAGVVVLVSLISPFVKDRSIAKKIIGEENFIEVFIDTPIEICIERDPKGLYKKAFRGEILYFTGVNSDYEPPLHPKVHLYTQNLSPNACVDEVYQFVYPYLQKTKRSFKHQIED